MKDIFEGRRRGVAPTPSGKRTPLGLDAEGVLFIFIIVLLVVAAVATANMWGLKVVSRKEPFGYPNLL